MQNIRKKLRKKSSLELARLCARAGVAKKAEDVLILDVRKLCSFTDFFVILSGRSTRHTQGLADAIEEELGSKRLTAENCEGLQEGAWILLDFVDVIIHIFHSETRSFYDLEGLWHDAPRLAVDPPKPAPKPRSKKKQPPVN